ncbi:hypothetical protein Lesp02_03570 [Lentzea sp. NBRC 105346]|uniref:hypothetical protein n=1 Tax=Lentzea sp. NBRC 105346 TaxID=3032205 RepID=UPI0024A003BE|nr:hypothetical protein [Lentzea sp. NBRC 105346]GLZ28167.1 hypothetical protein Lesp02_03570 [Lentzea sp. NBRC 105346]
MSPDSGSLGWLVSLMHAGWRFTPTFEDGNVAQLNGVHTWAHSAYADGVMILSPTEAKALRTDPDGGVVWERVGTLPEVAAELLGLPHPDAPGAPRLVRASVPRLWTP